MEPKGSVLLKQEFVHTKIWPDPQFTLQGIINLEKEYKEALAGKMVTVMDIAVDESGYLVYGDSKKTGPFIWMIEKGDTRGFIPLYKQNGVIVPGGLSPMEKAAWMAKEMMADIEKNTKDTKHEEQK